MWGLVTINGFNSQTLSLQYEVPQGSVLVFLLFKVYINNLHNVIKFSQSFHFADTICKINRSLNKGLKEQKNFNFGKMQIR